MPTLAFPNLSSLPANTPVRIIAFLAPVVIPTVYLIYWTRSINSQSTSHATTSPPDPSPVFLSSADDNSVPEEVRGAAHDYIIAHERVVSHPILLIGLRPDLGSGGKGILETYLQATMGAFSWTPQAFIMQAMIADPAAKASFRTDVLAGLSYRPGDRLCGVYVLSKRFHAAGGEKAVLELSPPAGWTGPVVKGRIVAGYEVEEGSVRLVNETILWRKKDEPSLPTESAVGKVMHAFMARWLVATGIKAIMAPGTKAKVV